MTAARQQYGYLAVMRVKGGIFTQPDGSREAFEEFAKAKSAQHDWVTEHLLPKATAEASAQRKSFISGCRVEGRRVKQPGFMTPPRIYHDVYDPAGTKFATLEGNADPAERISAEAQQRVPLPSADRLLNASGTSLTETVVWAVGVYLDGKYERRPAFENWGFGLPIDGLLELINELAEHGWSVAHVSEDRGLYAGATNRTDSSVTTARYLLVRDT